MRYGKVGLTEYDRARATPGFTLFSPLQIPVAYLMGMRGEVVHRWNLDAPTGNYGYLLPSGNLLAAVKTETGPKGLSAQGGRIQELDWDGNLAWEYVDHYQHHDFRRCANGNTVYLGWELLSAEAAGRVKGGVPGSEHEDGIWGDYLREVTPAGETVWEWHAEEHMRIEDYPICPICPRAEFAHPNTVFPLENGDMMVSWRHNHLIAIIDRASGKFAWEKCDPMLGHQHDVQMLPNGNILLFVNGAHAPKTRGSTVVEFNKDSDEVIWEYKGRPLHTFNSTFISGAQRLDSGNTLICEGQWGRIFEVTEAGNIVWEYISPHFASADDPSPTAGTNAVFRAYRYAPDSPEINGRLDDYTI